MPEWSIGDRVVCLVDHPDHNDDLYIGSTGTVCRETQSDGPQIGVCWDDRLQDGHDCGGSCEYGHGWFVSPDAIELEVEDETTFEFNEEEFNKLVFGRG